MNEWKSLKIGNFLKSTITLIKDYGIILKIVVSESEEDTSKNVEKTGLIINENLAIKKENYKIGDEVFC